MRVIFLDVDGVLNSTRSLVVTGAGYAGMMVRRDDPRLDPVAVGLLMKIVVAYDFNIVLSSTWRIGFSTEELVEMWQDSMLRYYGWNDFPLIGRTSDMDAYRGAEIDAWLNEHPEVEDFIILDDDRDMLPEQIDNGHFYHVDLHVGLDHRVLDFVAERFGEEISPIIGV